MAPPRKPRTRHEALAERWRQQQAWRALTPGARAALFGHPRPPAASSAQMKLDV